MTITQTVKIPINRRLILDVPREIPTESVIITFTPVSAKMPEKSEARDIELFKQYADELNAEAEDVLLYQDLKLWNVATSTVFIKAPKTIQGNTGFFSLSPDKPLLIKVSPQSFALPFTPITAVSKPKSK